MASSSSSTRRRGRTSPNPSNPFESNPNPDPPNTGETQYNPTPHASRSGSRSRSTERPQRTFYSHTERRDIVIPSLADEIQALHNWTESDRPWQNTSCLFPNPLYTLEEA